MALSSHHQRIVTAAVLLPALIGCVLAGGWWLFGALFAACAMGLWEFYSLFWTGWVGLGKKLLGLALCALLLLAAKREDPHLLIGVVLFSFWAGNMFFLFWYSLRPEQTRYTNAAIVVLGLLYLPLTLQFVLFMQPREIFLVLMAAIVSDTAAYYAGTYLGRHRIWPAISPKKTWEGSLAGLAACALAVMVYGLLLGHSSWWEFLALGLALNVAAQFGDFFESALKRWLGVKDSGHILPGHGGMLDRIDSLLLVVPTYAACRSLAHFFHHVQP